VQFLFYISKKLVCFYYIRTRHNNVICEIGVIKLNIKNRLYFLDFFEVTDEMFIAKYKPRYPNHSFQIFKHKRKPLSKMTERQLKIHLRLNQN